MVVQGELLRTVQDLIAGPSGLEDDPREAGIRRRMKREAALKVAIRKHIPSFNYDS